MKHTDCLFIISRTDIEPGQVDRVLKIRLVRIQQILAHELGIADTVDPLGGSYFIESLTTEIENQILAELKKIEEIGGAIKAFENGYYSSQLSEGAIRRKREFDEADRISVGVNKFKNRSSIPSGAFRIDPDTEIKQIKRLRNTKQQRNQKKVKEALEHFREAAKKEDNLVPPAIEAVKVHATVGEMCKILREEFGEYQAREYFT